MSPSQSTYDGCLEHGRHCKKNRLSIDVEGLSTTLAVPVVLGSARTGVGVARLLASLASPARISEGIPVAEQASVLARDSASEGNSVAGVAFEDRALYEESHRLAKRYGPAADALLQMQSRVDRFFLLSFTGGIAFVAVMLTLFQSIFTCRRQ